MKRSKAPTITIHAKGGITYIKEAIRAAGFVGEVEYILHPVSLVLIRPGADLKDVIQGLLSTIENIKLRQKYPSTDNP